MTIIIFHIGDDYKDDYNNKNILLKKCFKSIKREFKSHNIIVFHSFEEILEKFPLMRNDLKEKRFESFLASKSPQLKTDLYRILLTKYIDDMIYMDSDVYINRGQGENLINYLIEKSKYNNFIYHTMTCFFYSKKYTNSVEPFLDTFDEKYTSDLDSLGQSKIYENSDVLDIKNETGNTYFNHYTGWNYTFYFEKGFKFVISSKDFSDDLNYYCPISFYNIEKNSLKCIHLSHRWIADHFFNEDISIIDFLSFENRFDLIAMYKNILI